MSAPADPPPDFRGRFTESTDTRASFSRASGPVHLVPHAVASPLDEKDVQALVRWAANEEHPLVPRGAGTGMPGGNVGRGIAIDLATSFRWVGSPDVASRTLRVGAGAVAADVAAVAEAIGLSFPPLPSSADRCTIGGMIANNAAGARSFRHGAVRDWVVELRAVFADGSAATVSSVADPPPFFDDFDPGLDLGRDRRVPGWPAVRKNSSGYLLDRFLTTGDPVQLLVGSEGTLAVVTEATLRLVERPAEVALVLLPVAGPDRLAEVADRAGSVGADTCEFLGRRFLEIAGLEGHREVGPLARGAWGLALVEVAGSPESVAGGVRALVRALGAGTEGLVARSAPDRHALWSVRHAASPVIASRADEGLVSMQFIEDSVVPVERLADYLEGLDAILERAETDAVVFGHAGDGNVHVNPLVDVRHEEWRDLVRTILSDVARLVADLGGTLAGEHGDGRIRAPFLPTIWREDHVAAFRRVKDFFDPGMLLNPGVILPLEGQDPLDGLTPSLADRA